MMKFATFILLLFPFSVHSQVSSTVGNVQSETKSVSAGTAAGNNTSKQMTPSTSTTKASDTAVSDEHRKKLDALWKAYNSSNGLAEYCIKGYMNDPDAAKKDPNLSQYIKPAVQQRAIEEFGRLFKEHYAGFTDQEIEYLTQLFNSNVFKKMNAIDQIMWNKNTVSFTLKSVSAAAARGDFNTNAVDASSSTTVKPAAPFSLQPVSPKPVENSPKK